MKNTKPFKILSIDGGGIKGLYSATVLSNFEEEYNCLTSDHFDLICGTSTGGLIALAISQKTPAREICDFYTEHGGQIFPNRPTWLRWFEYLETKFFKGKYFLGQTLWYGKYNNVYLKKVLTDLFQDKTIGDSNNLLCVPSYCITEARPYIFKYDHTVLRRDNKTTYVDVALATSAAPTYFPVHQISSHHNKQFVDGGVWANNPTMIGLIEALKYFVGKDKEYDSIQILSISSLNPPNGKPTGWRSNRSFIGWSADLFELPMSGQSEFTEYFMKTISDLNHVPVKYLRIPSAIISKEQLPLINLDVAGQKSLDLIKGKGNDIGLDYRQHPIIQDLFTTPKTFIIKQPI